MSSSAVTPFSADLIAEAERNVLAVKADSRKPVSMSNVLLPKQSVMLINGMLVLSTKNVEAMSLDNILLYCYGIQPDISEIVNLTEKIVQRRLRKEYVHLCGKEYLLTTITEKLYCLKNTNLDEGGCLVFGFVHKFVILFVSNFDLNRVVPIADRYVRKAISYYEIDRS